MVYTEKLTKKAVYVTSDVICNPQGLYPYIASAQDGPKHGQFFTEETVCSIRLRRC